MTTTREVASNQQSGGQIGEMPWLANQWPLIWKTLFCSVPPATSSSRPETLGGLFELLVPFMAPWIALCVASRTIEIQGHGQVWRPRSGDPRPHLRITYANLDWNLLKFIVSKIERLPSLLVPPWLQQADRLHFQHLIHNRTAWMILPYNEKPIYIAISSNCRFFLLIKLHSKNIFK